MELIFNKLTNLIKKYDNILIMTHKNPDFDGMGSAIGLQQIIKEFNKESYIVINNHESNKSLKKCYQLLKENNIYFQTVTKQNYLQNNSLLIILDTHKKEMVECKELLEKIENVVVLDHHIKSKNYIKSNCINYINANLSSTVEFMARYIKYLHKKIHPLVATFMLVGLEIDTFNFRLKTTSETYEAASFLTNLGADSILKQELLQEKQEDYIARQRVIEQTVMINDYMALCIANNKIYENKDLAEIAEELLQFKNVQASFVIGTLKNCIGISSRSIGKINVEEIMELMGGGGHFTEAATQIKNKSIEEVKQDLIKVIENRGV